MNIRNPAIQLLIIILFGLSSIVYPKGLDSLAVCFIRDLIRDSDDLQQYICPAELQLSERLGISYRGIKKKFLISNDIEALVLSSPGNDSLAFDYEIKDHDDFSILKLTVSGVTREYCFIDEKLVSKPFCYTRNWNIYNSEFFVFHYSDQNLFNEYSANRLDMFVREILALLHLDDAESERLKKEKIHYFLCKDQDEIELLTNYKARGLYFLAFDYIISTYNCHYHEIAHLLMNYKLKEVDLYTLPLLQEGFATAVGGRGGKEPHVISELGRFLAQSGFIDYMSLLTKADFYQYDPSLSYPFSGLYVKFLIEHSGIDSFLSLYRKYSGDNAQIDRLKTDVSDLPPVPAWQHFLDHPDLVNPVGVLRTDVNDFTLLLQTSDFSIYENDQDYLFRIKNRIAVKIPDLLNYNSKLFDELYPRENYQGEKYIITANEQEVSVYNLYTNNLVVKYTSSFSRDNHPVIQENGYFIFTIHKDVFDAPLEPNQIVNMDT